MLLKHKQNLGIQISIQLDNVKLTLHKQGSYDKNIQLTRRNRPP